MAHAIMNLGSEEFRLDPLKSPFDEETIDLGEIDGEAVRFAMLKDIANLLDPEVSQETKWDLWEWIHTENAEPFSFATACREQGCDPIEVVEQIHETLERGGVEIRRPPSAAIRRSPRKEQMLRRVGISVQPSPMQQYVGKPRRGQRDLFFPDGEMEDLSHG